MFVRDGDWQVLETLVRAGADVNAKDNDGWTPLIMATVRDSTGNFGDLFYHGADINARDVSGRNALAYVGYPRAAHTAERLLREGLRMTAADREAAIAGSEECHRLLVDALRRAETQD